MSFPITSAQGGNIPANVANALLAGDVPISLLELQLQSGDVLFLSDALALVVPVITPPAAGALGVGRVIGGGPVLPPSATLSGLVQFNPWIVDDGAPTFSSTGTLVTQNGTARIQNLSGNAIQRDNAMLFSEEDIWGALFVYRLWMRTAEFALVTQLGQVADTEIDDTEMELTLESWLNFSQIAAPDCQISNNCQNVFGSQQCGSTSATPCRNSYGNCSQINRFKGLITQWNAGVYSVPVNAGVAQPIPPAPYNPRKAS